MIDQRKRTQRRFADSLESVSRDPQFQRLQKISDEDLTSIEERGIQAGILVNSKQKIYDSAEGRDFNKTNNYGPYLPELLPIITAWYPEFPLKDLISVQDMESPLAYIITSELLAATGKADTLRGDKIETPTGLRTIKGSYPTGEVFGEELLAADFTTSGTKVGGNLESVGALVYYPILADEAGLANFKLVTSEDETWTVQSVVGGIINLAAGADETAEVEVSTGIITVKGVELVKATLNYTWNIEFADNSNIPSVIEDMKMVSMEAKPRAIAMEWTIFSEFVKKKQFGVDIRTQTTKRVLDLLYQYLVRYILDKMYFNAEGTPTEVTVGGSQVTLEVRVQETLKSLNDLSHKIQTSTGRIEGNCLVVGNDFKSFLESLPNTYYTPEASKSDYGFNGPRKLGKLGRYSIFYDNKLPADGGWMTYKGNEWYDAAYYLGVFLPIAPTDCININIKVKQAFIAMEAHRYDKPAAVIPLTFVNA